LALRALGIGPGDEVIVPPYTFYATASAVAFVGAYPVFADIQPGTFNLEPRSVEACISPRTRCIIPVHMGGRMCDMPAILAIAERHGLVVLEDAAHAHGSEWEGQRAGSFGTAGSFSFQASKNLTAGEGGAIVTNDTELFQRCWSLHHCGRDYQGSAWYGHPILGTNARMSEWQAAILLAQMERLDEQIRRREENAAYLDTRLADLPGVLPVDRDERITRNSYHLYLLRFHAKAWERIPRQRFVAAVQAEGIPLSAGYTVLLPDQPAFRSAELRRLTGREPDYDTAELPAARRAAELEGMWLPQSVLLAEREDMDDILEAIHKAYEYREEIV
jgi:dTDP-4-amino-4,6-dideoxygalactose transaminase